MDALHAKAGPVQRFGAAMSLTPAFLDELRARTSLSALIRRTVKLQKAGREWKGCCPFHNEKTPSFYVNDDKEFYHCFGCGAHGDAIRWMTDQRGLPFMDAVKELAQAAGMEVPQPDARAVQKTEKAKGLHQAMQAAADWFESQLGGLDGSAARELLVKRGISDETRRRFGLGYAPDSRSKLRTALRDFGDGLLIEAGLLIQVDGKEPYDRFRGRLMIPIRDGRGRVIAFGGRVIGAGEPKYLNSPETPLFDKSRTLYNLDIAQGAARKTGRVIAVEGYMDAIALVQSGIEDVVAPLGTALTEHQLERLWRLCEAPVLCFDGDAAGQKAAIRAVERALPLLAHDRTLNIARLSEGEDPDDIVRSGGKSEITRLIENATSLSTFIWETERNAVPLNTPEDRAGLGSRLRKHAHLIKDDFLRAEYLAEFNKLLWNHLHPEKQADTFSKYSKRKVEQGFVSQRVIAIARHGVDQIAIVPALLRGLLRHPSLIAPLAEMLIRVPISSMRLRQVRERLLDVALDNPAASETALLQALKEDALGPTADQLLQVSIAFSFIRNDSDPNDAERVLIAVIDALSAQAAIEIEIAEAQNRWNSDGTGSAYERLERLLTQKRQINEALKDAVMENDENAY